ncbi:glycine-rich domain-containing protein [Enterobacter roggenkampii]|uniref:glycine-rich domain-containing protein n=1 Tax=Enterobacter roggenkampii TaxID=1812935 RepID=UPI003D6F18FB
MALTLLTANNAQTVLAAGISASATSLTVNSGTGALFPAVTSGVSFFKLTLVDAATGQLSEIVHVTARTGDSMTIVRAQEGTTARAWSANDIAANMLTAGTIALLAPLDSPSLTGTPTVPTAAPGTNTTQAASTGFVGAAISAVSGRMLGAPLIFTSSGSYTPSAGAKAIIVQVVGGGGGGGGTPATSSTQNSVGGGGGGGAIAVSYIPVSSLTLPVSIAVGTAGSGVVGAAGVKGGDTSFGSYLTAGGGSGGLLGTAATSGSPYVLQCAAGGVATGGNIYNSGGCPGGQATYITISAGISGFGGSSPLGGGGGVGGSTASGGYTNGKGPGGGGAGSAAGSSASAQMGGSGVGGIVMIWELS